jgi:hypothetical protein
MDFDPETLKAIDNLGKQGPEKILEVGEKVTKSQAAKNELKALAPNFLTGLVMAGAAAAGAGLVAAIKNKMMTSNIKKNISDFSTTLQSDPAFKDQSEKNKAVARLYEIARVAPHVVLNRDLTSQIIKNKLHTGLTMEDKQRLAILQAQFYNQPDVSKFVPQMPMAKIGGLLADVVLIKQAGLHPSKSNIRYLAELASLPVLSALTFGAVNQGMSALKQKDLKEQLNQSFTKALGASDPDKEPLLQNKEKARQAFSTLAHFAPHVALDHQAARSFMNKIVSYDQGVDAGVIKELSEITKNLSNSNQPSPFVSGFATGANVSALPKIVGGGVEDISRDIALGV